MTLFAIGANGGAVTWDMLVDRVQDVLSANAAPNAMIWTPRTAASLAKSKDSNTRFISAPSPVAELAKFTTTTIPTNLTKGMSTNATEVYLGDFSQLLIATRTNLRLRRLDERYADTGEIAFMVYPRLDIALEHGPAFSVITDATN